MGQSEMPDCQSRKSFEQYKERLHISKACSKRISEEFQRQIDEGLQTNEGSQQPWESGPRIIPTMITQMPTGNEAGEYFGIHVSGSHINIVYTELSELPHAVKIVQTYSTPITEHLRNCGAEELFEHIAEEALMFSASISRNLVSRTNNILCGLAFSFPCTHASLQQGTLLKWSKGFNIDGVCGNDPALMLNCALKQRGLKAHVIALCNNTAAEVCATRYCRGPAANIAIALDTGSNASYVETIDNIRKLEERELDDKGNMIINTEWPAFNSPDIKILAEDKEIDKASQCPGDHFFEKLTSPLYLGEVVRRILLRIAEEEAWPRADNLHSSTGCGDLSIEQLISATEDTSDTLSEGGQLMQAVCRLDAIHFSQQIRQEV